MAGNHSPRRVTLFLIFCVFSVALGLCDERKAPPDIPLEQWLHGPNRTDFSASVKVLKPRLTYQQRYLVEVRAVVDGAVANHRQLVSWLIVENPSGKWDDQFTRNDAVDSMPLDKNLEVQIVSAFYATPATYHAALAVYDLRSKQLFLQHFQVVVDPPKKDSLTASGAVAPAVEFIEQLPGLAQSFDSLRSAPSKNVDAYWLLAQGTQPLPISSTKPLQIDVVVDFSDTGERAKFAVPLPYRHRSQPLYIETATAMAGALSGLDPRNGCLRVSAYDATSMQIVNWRSSPETLDWNSVRRDRLKKIQQISVSGLKLQKERPAFIRNFLQRLATPSSGCDAARRPAKHVIILVSQGFQFGEGAHKQSLDAREFGDIEVFYLRVDPSHQIESGFSGHTLLMVEPVFDQLPGLLKPTHPHVINISSPEKFHEALVHLVDRVAK